MKIMNTNSKKFVTATDSRKAYQGFTLIELMIAILIGFLITLALVAVFLNISRTNREMAKTNNQIEGARFALQILRDDVIHAGFWGPFVPAFDELIATGVPGDAPTAVPDPCLPYTAANWNATYLRNLAGIVVQAYDAIPATCNTGGNWPKIDTSTRQANTDVLVVRHAETCLAGDAGCEALTTNKLYIQASGCATEIAAGNRYLVAQATGPLPGPFTLTNRDCTTVAPVRKFTSSIYYVRNFARTPGDGIPTLMRSQFGLVAGVPAFMPPVELVEGIEGFRVELGIDSLSKTGASVNYAQAISWQDPANLTTPTNRGDGTPDGAFVHCTTATPCTAAQLTDAVVVRIHVLARAETPSIEYTDTKTYVLGGATMGPFNDKYKRHVFSTTVRLNNVSGRRETP